MYSHYKCLRIRYYYIEHTMQYSEIIKINILLFIVTPLYRLGTYVGGDLKLIINKIYYVIHF